jgi:hypothetical protein
MSEVITYVGIDAHKRELHVAMLTGTATTPVTWTLANDPKAIDRLRRKLEREAPGRCRSVTKPARAGMRCSGS